MRILFLFLLFLGCLKVCWAQPSDDICICELENTTAFNYFDSNTPAVVEYPKETIYSVFSFTSSWEDPPVVEVPTKESESSIYGAIPEDNLMVAESGKEQAGKEEEPEQEDEESVASAEAEVVPTANTDIGSGGGVAPQKKARGGASQAKKRYAGTARIKKSRKGKRMMKKKKPRFKKYKGKCPSF